MIPMRKQYGYEAVRRPQLAVRALLGSSHIAREKKGAVARSQNGLMRQPLFL